ncbi:MAG: prepilin peptidase, partial [Sedimentisphaerales bacterium]|nr:prepilin peptidase [Sedimentisphaerales bacterium]
MSMIVPPIIWVIFLFCLGASIGSFLNVVIYRLPREMSLVRPGSHCTSCDRPIAWFDNIPILSWFILRGRCRHCKARFSFRYALVELVTAGLFVGFYGAYFHEQVRGEMPPFMQGGAWIYAGHMVLICVLLASSLIDREHWIIPLSLSYTAVAVGLVGSAIWPYLLNGSQVLWRIVPFAGAKSAAWALGGVIGLLFSYLLVKTGIITRSFYEWEQAMLEREEKIKKSGREEVGPDDPVFP